MRAYYDASEVRQMIERLASQITAAYPPAVDPLTVVGIRTRGEILADRLVRFLEQAGYGFEERYLQKTPARSILIRMLKNLIAIYNKVEDVTKASRLTRFIEILGLPEKDE